ncbi:MAG: Hsp70 family protein [Proteobacteria bacterium]|nr:Hsp70 family protein [Pseudomonadota bacterium]
MGVIVGIDLGTTNSCVAIVRDGRPKVIEDERGYNILPSSIAMKGRGRFVVGHGARALILTHPKDTLYAVKRLLGRKFHSAEVQESMKHVSYDVVEGEHGSVLLRMGDIEVTPVEASSIILKAVKEIAEKAIGEPVADAVITVPANFTHAQRKHTMEAGEKAGLNVLRLLNEPTAAALAYGFKKDLQKKIAVFDLGGGTFDVSILECGEGVYEILGTAGNTFLGGEDFDYRVVNWLADTFQQQTGVDVRQDKEALQRLKDAAERAKCELSFVDRTPILIPRLAGEHNLEVELSREQLETMVQDLVNETIKITDSALRTANMSIEDLDEIILVGGMTRMPKIQETIRIFFGMTPCKGVHPEEVVAIGAAVHGYSLESETQSTLLLDVTPHALGMDTAGGFFKPIIEKNTTVPCSESRTFTTVKDGQREVKVTARQGSSKLAAENDFLGEFLLHGIREAEKMVPRIDVTFRIDANGILHVTAVDRDTSEAQQIEIRDYIAAATGEQPKAVTLARDDLEFPAGMSPGEGPTPTGSGAESDDPQERAFFGRLAKMAGVGKGKKKKKGKVDPAAAAAEPQGIVARDQDELAVATRSQDELAMVARSQDELAMADKFETGHADVDAPTGELPADIAPTDTSADPYAMAERDGSVERSQPAPPPEPAVAAVEPIAFAPDLGEPEPIAVGSASGINEVLPDLPDLEPQGMAEVPPEEEYDPYGVVPKGEVDSPFGTGLAVGNDVLDLDDDLDALDPFGIALRPEAEPEAPRDEGIQFSTPLAQPEATPSAAPTAPADKKKKRRPARLRISYKKASTFLNEYKRNLKRGGTFIKTKKPLDVGRDCVLHLTIPGFDDPVELRGSVVWSSKGVEVMAGQEEGMGIKYDPADTSGVESLKSAIKQLESA